ncbi:protocadherin 1 [Echinococcus multilocularis]|uniref:Protocadherin 1 n=1 Tax=Echinococcus multilocularis TaxID=6211 RepID=A0A087W118_ECHMU|nr:protocadherin 1 [Echinococcus multilocularis]
MGRYHLYRYLFAALLLASTAVSSRVQKRSTLDTLYAELSVVEEQDVDTFAENLDFITRQALERARIQWADLRPRQITLLEPNPYFRICLNEALNTSFLCLKKRIDREQLCPTEGVCCSRFQQHQKSFDGLASPTGEMRQDDCSMSLILMVDLVSIFDNVMQQRLLSLSIRVLDINDHAPTWQLQRTSHPLVRSSSDHSHLNAGIPVLNLPIREHTKVGTKIELPEAVDPDAYPENTTVNYGIESDVDGLFSLEWTGKSRSISNFIDSNPPPYKLWLVLNKELDRDKQKSHQVKIFAADGGAVKPQTGYLMLNITVEDVNDHPPKFEKNKDLVWVLEHSPIGSVIYRLRASDKDESDLGKLEFGLAASVTSQVASLFVVDKRTGEIRVQGELDYEKITSYKLSVTVTDGLWFDEAVIVVGILNINDHPPAINLHSHLTATSRFHLFDPHHRVSGSQLTIEVKENGPPDQLIATFTVTDGDDAAEARFLRSNNPIRDAFLQANGLSLQEATERLKQPPRCKLNNEMMEIELLNLDSQSHKARFQVRLAKKPLDREVSAKYLVRIECWDQADRFGNHILVQSNLVGYRNSFSRSKSVVFTVVVLDENDSVPQFVEPLVGSIAEGQPVGTLISHITANDADDPYTLNGQAGLRYSIVGEPDVTYVSQSNPSNLTFPVNTQGVSTWFTLDPRTGELRSAVIFDREVVSFFNLTVSVTDGGEETNSSLKRNSAFTTVQITVSDVNDCQPVFDTLVYQLNISESATPPLLVGEVHANDCDADEINRRLYYWLQQQPSNSTSAGRWFTVSRTGELYLGSKVTNDGKVHDWRPLDREREELIVLEVLARDHGQPSLTGSAQVIIRLQDVNDNSPVWHFPKPNERVINISLDASVGQRIAELNATDNDEGDFGKVTYSIISGNEEGHFELDEQTGCLYISRPFTATPISAPSSTSTVQEANSTTAISTSTTNLLLENRLRMLSFKTFRLYLRASDQGKPARITTAVLDVRLSGLSFSSHDSKISTTLSRPNTPPIHTSATYREQKVVRSRSNQQNHLPSGKLQQYQQDHDNLISTESLIIITVMVAAVAALLFIVVLLAIACLRKRMLTEQSRRQCPTAVKPKLKSAEFELQFAGEDGEGNGGGPGSTIAKKIYGVSSQPPPFIDPTSTYVTVTRNTLKGDDSCHRAAVGAPNDITTAYTVQSFDNLDTIQADVLSPYRFEKVVGSQPAGILMQAPSSSLLTMDPRIAQSGTTEESVDVSESSLAQKEKIFSVENTSRKMSTTTYTLAGKAPVICSSMGTLSSAVSPQTLPRNHPKAAYVALSPAPVAYAAEAVQTPEGVLLGGKCLTFSKPMAAPGSGTGPSASPSSASPFLIKLAKPAGFLLDTEGSRTYTPLNFSVPENAHHHHQPPTEDSGSNNQESSFV